MALILLIFLILLCLFALRYRTVDLSFRQLLGSLRTGCTEYSLTAAAAAMACILSLVLIYQYVEGQSYFRLLAMLAVSIPLSYGVAAIVKKSGLSPIAAAAAALLVCAAFGLWAARTPDAVFLMHMLVYALAASALVSAGQALRSTDNLQFWEENLRIAFILGVAGLVGGVLDFGLSAIMLSLHYLFDIEVKYNLYLSVAAICGFVVPTFVFLALAVRADSLVRRSPALFVGLSIVKDYVLIPLALVYTIILYGYGVRILFMLQLPKGMVGWMVSSYAVVGLLIWLASYPKDARVASSARFFFRRYFLLLLPLLLLLGAAVTERIGQYGFTESRYFLLLFLIWIGLIAVYYLRRPAAPLRAMPLTIFALLLFSAFSPWSAFSVSRRSQEARWFAYLEELRNNAAATKYKSEAELSRICDYLAGRHGIETIVRALPAGGDVRSAPGSCTALFERLHITYHERYRQGGENSYFVYSASMPAPIDVHGYDYLFRDISAWLDEPTGTAFRTTMDRSRLKVLRGEETLADIPFAETVLERLENMRAQKLPLRNVPKEQLAFEFETLEVKARLIFVSLQVRVESDVPQLSHFSAILLLKIKGRDE